MEVANLPLKANGRIVSGTDHSVKGLLTKGRRPSHKYSTTRYSIVFIRAYLININIERKSEYPGKTFDFSHFFYINVMHSWLVNRIHNSERIAPKIEPLSHLSQCT